VQAFAYAVAAVSEETGWTGFAPPRMAPSIGELPAGLATGAASGLWHVVPYLQAGHSAWWVAGQCVFSVVFRVLLVRLALWQRGPMCPAAAAHASFYGCSGSAAREPLKRWTRSVTVATAAARPGWSSY
jgi:uncharacterized protein